MTHSLWTRRKFLHRATGAATALAIPSLAASKSPLQGRFLTHISVVRVNQIEVSPTRSIGQDESALNTPQHIRSRREAFARGCPNGKMTWAISWLALNDTHAEYQQARRLLASYHDRYGDEITFIPGGYFAPMYNSQRKHCHSERSRGICFSTRALPSQGRNCARP
ncbi:MAG: DUF3863 domain-containing protein [Acidobacteriaceae bacterium]